MGQLDLDNNIGICAFESSPITRCSKIRECYIKEHPDDRDELKEYVEMFFRWLRVSVDYDLIFECGNILRYKNEEQYGILKVLEFSIDNGYYCEILESKGMTCLNPNDYKWMTIDDQNVQYVSVIKGGYSPATVDSRNMTKLQLLMQSEKSDVKKALNNLVAFSKYMRKLNDPLMYDMCYNINNWLCQKTKPYFTKNQIIISDDNNHACEIMDIDMENHFYKVKNIYGTHRDIIDFCSQYMYKVDYP